MRSGDGKVTYQKRTSLHLMKRCKRHNDNGWGLNILARYELTGTGDCRYYDIRKRFRWLDFG
jgi:hypothetical protein